MKSKKTKAELLKEIDQLNQRISDLESIVQKNISDKEEDKKISPKMEKFFANSYRNYRNLVENSIQGIMIIQNKQIIFANKALADILGYSVEELVSMSYKQTRSLFHPEDRQRSEKYIEDQLSGKNVPIRYELRAYKKSGELRWLDISANLIEYKEGPAIQSFIIDITDKKRAEEAVKKNELRLSSMLEAISDPISMIDRELNIIWVNQAASISFIK